MTVIVLNAIALVLHEMAARGSPIRGLCGFGSTMFAWCFSWSRRSSRSAREAGPTTGRNGWNRFDFLVVVLSLPALLSPLLACPRSSPSSSSCVSDGSFGCSGCCASSPTSTTWCSECGARLRASVGVFLGLLLINLILAMMATLLFRDLDPEHFGNPDRFRLLHLPGLYGRGLERDRRGSRRNGPQAEKDSRAKSLVLGHAGSSLSLRC